jgi:RimJ/RimL family protein N-acetyltransferase
MVTIEATRHETHDGRAWTLRAARPTDAGALARLFADVRGEGRYLVTPATAISEPSEAFFIGEMIRSEGSLALVGEADGSVIGNVLVNVERNLVSNHLGTLSICVAADWRDSGVGGVLVRASIDWARQRGLAKVALGVFPDNARAIAVYEHAGFVTEGLRRRQYRSADNSFRDELLMAWFPAEEV